MKRHQYLFWSFGYNCIFTMVKKQILAILLLFSFHALILHDMIPHQHHDQEDIGLVNDHDHNNHQEAGHDSDHPFPIPAHQHLSAAEDFNIIRTQQSFSFVNKIIISFFSLYADYFLSFRHIQLVKQILWPLAKIPICSFPFIISPNAMRGSPSDLWFTGSFPGFHIRFIIILHTVIWFIIWSN